MGDEAGTLSIAVSLSPDVAWAGDSDTASSPHDLTRHTLRSLELSQRQQILKVPHNASWYSRGVTTSHASHSIGPRKARAIVDANEA